METEITQDELMGFPWWYVKHGGMSLENKLSCYSHNYYTYSHIILWILVILSCLYIFKWDLANTFYYFLSKAICGWMVRQRLMMNDAVLDKEILELRWCKLWSIIQTYYLWKSKSRKCITYEFGCSNNRSYCSMYFISFLYWMDFGTT